MTFLEATGVVARRALSAAGALSFAVAVAALVATGFFASAPGEPLAASRLLVLGLWVAVFGWRTYERHRLTGRERHLRLRDAELGLLLVVLAHSVVQMAGGVEGPAYPLVYVLVAYLSTFLAPLIATLLVGASLGLEAATVLLGDGAGEPRTVAVHGAFVVFFAVLNVAFTRTEIARLRRSTRKQVEEELSRAEQTAREFRLLSAPSSQVEDVPPDEVERRRLLSAVVEVRQSLFFTLDLLKRSLELHTCALLWLEASGRLRLAELVSDSDGIAPGPFDTLPGALGAALSSGQPVNLERVRGKLAGVVYYRDEVQLEALVAVPVVEHGICRGVLCADRITGGPFGKREEAALGAATHQILRAVENERVFVALERAKNEQTKLYRASEALGAALSERDVIDAVLGAARGIASYDFAAVALYDSATRRHSVVRAVGEGSDKLEGLSFGDNAGLAAMAVKNRHYLPYRGEFDCRHQVVYTRKTQLKGMESLLILPLVSHDEPLGTLTLAAQQAGVFTDTVRRTLQVLANQMATSVSNARMVKRLEEMATTDGLTGLHNHRTFQEELERKLKSAERFERRLSVVLTDLDHFKLVNDTYGHPVGDQVLRGFARILEKAMRETDLVARYGGEEFAVICEQTDAAGARQLAERIRTELEQQTFHCEQGQLQVTCSLGIATYPDHGRTKEQLVECADQALYAAKERGRNRSEVFRCLKVASR